MDPDPGADDPYGAPTFPWLPYLVLCVLGLLVVYGLLLPAAEHDRAIATVTRETRDR